MPATPSQLRRPILVDTTLDFGAGVTVTFRFDRNKITDAWLQEWTRLEEGQDISAINEALADLIHEWDVVGDDGAPYPPTPEHIGYLFNLPDKARIVRDLMNASVPTSEEGNASATTSSSASTALVEPPANLQNGLATSTLPPVSASPSPT